MSRVGILVVTIAYYVLSKFDHDAKSFGLLERMSIEQYHLKEVGKKPKSGEWYFYGIWYK
jgi:hypothetical protein